MLFVKGWLFSLFQQLTIPVLVTTQQLDAHPCLSLALSRGMKHLSSRGGGTVVLSTHRHGDSGFIKTYKAVNTSHKIRTDLAQLRILAKVTFNYFCGRNDI